MDDATTSNNEDVVPAGDTRTKTDEEMITSDEESAIGTEDEMDETDETDETDEQLIANESDGELTASDEEMVEEVVEKVTTGMKATDPEEVVPFATPK